MNIKTVGVLGSGQMGRGTAHVAALAGYKVIFYNHRLVTLEKALKYIESELDKGIERGKTTQEDKERTLTNITITDQLSDLAKADFLIESLPEVLEIKQQTFAELDKLCGPEVIFATNTTSLSITELASVTDRPDRFIGMHFFNPVHKMKLIEMVNGLETSPETTAITKELGISFGKEVVTVKESPGFVTSRIQAIIGNEAFIMLNEGLASAEDIDKSMKLGCNHPMGPLALGDLIGLDTCLHIMDTFYAETCDSKYRASRLMRQMVRGGKLGRKSGEGFFKY